MLDLSKTIVAKSDQLNADDLIGTSKTIKITKVSLIAGDQPVVINYDGDEGKPYKPCKGMRRAMVRAWGSDGDKYVGRSMVVWCNPQVTWAGSEVGGIQISHMSHIEKKIIFSLAMNRKKKVPYTILPLEVNDVEKAKITDAEFDGWCQMMDKSDTMQELASVAASIKAKAYDAESSDSLRVHYDKAVKRIRAV